MVKISSPSSLFSLRGRANKAATDGGGWEGESRLLDNTKTFISPETTLKPCYCLLNNVWDSERGSRSHCSATYAHKKSKFSQSPVPLTCYITAYDISEISLENLLVWTRIIKIISWTPQNLDVVYIIFIVIVRIDFFVVSWLWRNQIMHEIIGFHDYFSIEQKYTVGLVKWWCGQYGEQSETKRGIIPLWKFPKFVLVIEAFCDS